MSCICLRWQESNESLDDLSSRRELDLILFDSVEELMHIVRQNAMISLIDKNDEWSITDFKTFGGTDTEENKMFYENRFFSKGNKEFDIVESDYTLTLKTW